MLNKVKGNMYDFLNDYPVKGANRGYTWNPIKGRCKHYGGVSCFCGCAKDWVPGRCSIYRKYNKRKKDKNKKIFDALTEAEQQVLRFTVNNSEITEKDNPGAFVKAMKTLMKKGFLYSCKPGEYNVRGKGRKVIELGAPKEKQDG